MLIGLGGRKPMTHRKTSRNLTAVLAATALLIAAADAANAAHANRSPATGGTSTTSTTKPVHPDYGRGWCYRHPYACQTQTAPTRTQATQQLRLPGANHAPNVTLKRGAISN
jgi:carbohydrate-selective porin OprB